MDKTQVPETLRTSFQKLHLNLNSNSPNNPPKHYIPSSQKPKPRSLVSLCLGFLGKHFEDILEDLVEISSGFPPDIKMTLTAIARRRKLLNDDVLTALAEGSWEIIDLSDSELSDLGLSKVAETCKNVRAVDIRACICTNRGG